GAHAIGPAGRPPGYATGNADASSAARGPVFLPAPGGQRRPPRAPSRARWDLGGPQGRLTAPASRRFLSRAELWLPAPPRRRGRLVAPLRVAGGRGLPALAGPSPSPVFPGLLDLEPPFGPPSQAPAACT